MRKGSISEGLDRYIRRSAEDRLICIEGSRADWQGDL